jgi:dihydrofolate reductase
MGRRTFETVTGFDSWPYSVPVFVLSESLSAVPEPYAGKAELMSGNPGTIVAGLARRGYTNLYVDGGRTIQRFLDEDLIDELIITRIPVLLGGGTPLFGDLAHPLSFVHHSTTVLSAQMTQSRYVRDRR